MSLNICVVCLRHWLRGAVHVHDYVSTCQLFSSVVDAAELWYLKCLNVEYNEYVSQFFFLDRVELWNNDGSQNNYFCKKYLWIIYFFFQWDYVCADLPLHPGTALPVLRDDHDGKEGGQSLG